MKSTYPHPPPDHNQTLAHIAELSRNARATWFGLIGLCVFVGVTLLGHKDADFFAFGAETQLPLVNVKIPVNSFFFAPVLVSALYIYLHLYLINLWDALADAPARIDNQPLADQVFPWLISHAALWYRNRARQDRCTAPRALGWVVVAVSVTLGWLFGLVILAGLWLRSLPAHAEGLTLWIALCLWAATAVGYTGFHAARARMQDKPRSDVAQARKGSGSLGGALAVILAILSWETTEGSGIIKYPFEKEDGSIDWRLPLYPADLREAVLIAKPDDWQPYDRWLKDFAIAYRKENSIAPKDKLTPAQQLPFWAEARDEWSARLASLAGPELRQRDLRNADMARADLRGARLDGANLTEAELQGAELNCWEPSNSERYCSSLRGANLRVAKMQGADLSGAKMQDANLSEAKMQGVNLFGAQMQDANLFGALMQGANLFVAELQRADLSEAQMQGANLIEGTSKNPCAVL